MIIDLKRRRIVDGFSHRAEATSVERDIALHAGDAVPFAVYLGHLTENGWCPENIAAHRVSAILTTCEKSREFEFRLSYEGVETKWMSCHWPMTKIETTLNQTPSIANDGGVTAKWDRGGSGRVWDCLLVCWNDRGQRAAFAVEARCLGQTAAIKATNFDLGQFQASRICLGDMPVAIIDGFVPEPEPAICIRNIRGGKCGAWEITIDPPPGGGAFRIGVFDIQTGPISVDASAGCVRRALELCVPGSKWCVRKPCPYRWLVYCECIRLRLRRDLQTGPTPSPATIRSTNCASPTRAATTQQQSPGRQKC